MITAFKKATALVLAFSPLAGFQAQALAQEKNPADPRLEKLEKIVREPQRNCFFTDTLPAARSDRARAVRDLIEITNRTRLGQSLTRGFTDTTAFCVVDPQDNLLNISAFAGYHQGKDAFLFMNQFNEQGFMVFNAAHEFHHKAQKDGGHSGKTKDADFDTGLRETIEPEIDANVVMAIAAYMTSQSQYSARPYRDSLAWAEGSRTYVATRSQPEMTAAARDPFSAGQGGMADPRQNLGDPGSMMPQGGVSANNYGLHDAPVHETDLYNRQDMKRAVEALKKIGRENPEWLEDGRAARVIYEIFHQEGIIARIYTHEKLRHEMLYASALLGQIALKDPEFIKNGQASGIVQEYLASRGITANAEALKYTAEKIVRSAGNLALKIARKNPDSIQNNTAYSEIYRHMNGKGDIRDICDRLYEARQEEGRTIDRAALLTGTLENLGTIHYQSDYRKISLPEFQPR